MPTQRSRTINTTAGSILGFLHDGPKSGWDLASEIPADIGDYWSITKSQIYRELHSLARNGLIEAGEPGPRDRVAYTLTDAGRAVFQEWIVSPIATGAIRFPFLLQIRFGVHMPNEQLESILREFYLQSKASLEAYIAERAAFPDHPPREMGLRLAALEYGIENARAAIRWYESLPENVRGPLCSNDADDQA